MDDPDQTVPVPKPVPYGGGKMTDSRFADLLQDGANALAPRTTPPGGWQPPTLEQLQQALPQYEITQFIARGGMGAVYKGTQKTLKRSVAIKVLPPDIDDGDMQFAERFKREAQSMAQLTHPNIVAVHDAGETPQGLLYFVMEFIEGTDVAQLIQSEKRLDPQRAMSITTAVCDALAFAHEEGIIHRDIKPSNIMLDKKGRVKVADFGLARAVNLDSTMLTGSNVAMGTPDFIAPEAMISGMAMDGRADIYAVGVMLYQMLTGSIPRGRFALPSGVVPQIDPRLDAIVDKAMQTDREKRYSTATEMKTDVERVVRSSDISPGAPAPDGLLRSSASTPARQTKSRAVLLTAAVVVIALVAGALVALKKSASTASAGSVVSSSILSVSKSPTTPHALSPAEKFPAGQWVNAVADLSKLPGLAEFQDGWARMTDSKPDYYLEPRLLRNVGIRVHRQAPPNWRGLQLVTVRNSSGKKGRTFELHYYAPGSTSNPHQSQGSLQIREFRPELLPPLPTEAQKWTAHVLIAEKAMPPIGSEFTVEFIAVFGTLRARINDESLTCMVDEGYRGGGVSVFGANKIPFRDVELLDLDGLSEAEARKAAGMDEQGKHLRNPEAPIASSSTMPPSTERWENMLSDSSKLILSDKGASRTPEGLLLTENAQARTNPDKDQRRDGAVRMRATFGGGTPILRARLTEPKSSTVPTPGTYQLSAKQENLIILGRYDNLAKRYTSLREFALRDPLLPGQGYDLELRTLGQHLTAKLNGEILGTVIDETYGEGGFGVGVVNHLGDPVLVKSLEVLYLDAAGKDALTLVPSDPAAIKLWDSAAKLPTPGHPGVSWDDDALHISNGKSIAFTKRPSSDAILRASVRMNADLENPQLGLRYTPHATDKAQDKDSFYYLKMDTAQRKVSLVLSLPAEYRILKTWTLPRTYGTNEWVRLEIKMIGHELAASIDGTVLGTIEDSTLSGPGFVMLFAGANGYFRDIEYVPLDDPKEMEKAAAPPEPAAIKLWDTPEKLPKKEGITWENNAVRLDKKGLNEMIRARDLIFRAKVLAKDTNETSGPILTIRMLNPGINETNYSLAVSHDFHQISLNVSQAKKRTELERWQMPRLYAANEWVGIELRAIGDELTVSVDGTMLGTVRDGTLTRAGGVQIFANLESWFRDIEYVPLDKTVGTGLPPSSELWQDVLRDEDKLGLTGAVERTAEGLLFTGFGSAHLKPGRGPERDAAVRMRWTLGGVRPMLRARANDVGIYQLGTRGDKQIVLSRWDNSIQKAVDLRSFPVGGATLKQGQDYELELRVVGTTLTVKFNGDVLGTVTDTAYSEGRFGVGTGTFNPDTAPSLVKSIEVLDLNAPGKGASSLVPAEPAAYPQPPKWTDATAALRAAGEKFNSVVVEGEWIKAVTSNTLSLGARASNPIVRVLFSDRVDIRIRRSLTETGDDCYLGSINHRGSASIVRTAPSRVELVAKAANSSMEGEHEAVFAAQGDTLTLWLDGTQVVTAQDKALISGTIALGLTQGDPNGDGRIKKVEWGELPDLVK